jgi:hypothetical protein
MPLPRFVRSRRHPSDGSAGHRDADDLRLPRGCFPAFACRKTRRRFHARVELPVTHCGSEVEPDSPAPAARPGCYGRADARFTVVEYADLECPFCRAYFAVLKRWIDEHPEVAWQWHHLPLSMHQPAASAAARLVECVGQTGGHAAFWQAVEWVYANTRGDGQGLPEGLRYPDLTPTRSSASTPNGQMR